MNRDPFLSACPLYRDAQSKGSRNGDPLEVVSHGPSLRPWFLVAIALAGLVAMCALAAQGG